MSQQTEDTTGRTTQTPEPWHTLQQPDATANEATSVIQAGNEYLAWMMTPSNAARIVAAVNAVAGMTTEELRTLGFGGLAKLYAGEQPNR